MSKVNEEELTLGTMMACESQVEPKKATTKKFCPVCGMEMKYDATTEQYICVKCLTKQ